VSKQVHVAVAVIINSQQQVLLGLRQAHQHQGGLWEFPGGKVETSETPYDALVREVGEEVGLTIKSAEPLIEISHDYGDKSVLLDVWWVEAFSGEAIGKEGQRLRWSTISGLNDTEFPAANVAIIQALKSRVK
jgi:8-oxo-dGTP diphosphatase